MKWIHRTNYWGSPIDAQHDPDVDFKAIWVQAMVKDSSEEEQHCCCPGFGQRRVTVDLENLLLFQHDGKFSLYHIRSTNGRNPDHCFHDFALIQSGTPGLGKRKCKQKGWHHRGDFNVRAKATWRRLENSFQNYIESIKGENTKTEHIHIAIRVDQIHAPKGNS